MKLIVLWLLASTSFAAQVAQDPPDLANVQVNVSTTFAEPISRSTVVLRAVGPAIHYKQLGGATLHFDRIPFGLYDLDVESAGFASRHERVGIYQKDLNLWIGLFPASLHGTQRSEIVGSITMKGDGHKDLWVRLVPLYASDFLEDRVTPGGIFQLGNVHPGRYFLLVFDQERLLLSKIIDYQSGKLTLTLIVE